MTAKTYRVTGQVQGVGFRWSAQAEARRLGVVGWVTNEGQNTVTGFVQGPADRVEAFVAWVRQGPPRARVDQATVDDAAPQPALASFLVRP